MFAQEFAGSGVTVNVVVPGGPTDTPMVYLTTAVDFCSPHIEDNHSLVCCQNHS